MSIEVTARHMNASTDLHEHAQQRAEALVKEFPRIVSVHVILDIEKHRQGAEVVVHAPHHIQVESREVSDTMRASIDTAFEKVEKQLRRANEKAHEHRVRPAGGE